MKNRMNYKLVLGLLFLSFFLFIGIFGSNFAPYDLNFKQAIEYKVSDDNYELLSPPFPPSKEFIFGTDKFGYDILTKMLHGAKYTVFTIILVALLRTLIGAIAGIINGLSTKTVVRKTRKVTVLSSIPNFIIIYFVMLGINIEPVISILTLVLIQGTLMTVLGISGVYDVVFAKTVEIKQSLFVEASQTLGGSKIHIMKTHIFPILKGNLISLFVNEAIQVSHLVGQLAIFNLFFGGTAVQYVPITYFSITNEWAGLIGQSKDFVYFAQWILLIPLVTYLLFMFTFHLILVGLKEMQKKEIQKTMYL